MLKKTNKRRRTKAQIEEDKQEEVLKRQRLASDMATDHAKTQSIAD